MPDIFCLRLPIVFTHDLRGAGERRGIIHQGDTLTQKLVMQSYLQKNQVHVVETPSTSA